MRLFRWFVVPSSLVVAALAAVPSSRESRDPAGDIVRRHLDSVLVELRANSVGSPTDVRQMRRARLIDELAAYRNRGVFPHNYDFPGQLVPYFRDRETGALCAVGDLLAFTGRTDIVERAVRLDNNVRVARLAADTALRNWLGDNGLTLAEAARIQVAYAVSTSPAQMAGTAAALLGASLGSVVSFTTALENTTSNRNGESARATTLGVVSGLVAMGAGGALLHSPDLPHKWGALSLALGSAGFLSSTYAHRNHGAVVREAERKRRAAEVAFTPTLELTPRGDAPRVGGSLSLHF